MTKQERQDRLKELIEADELTPNQILGLLVEESGVTERTVRADFAELYPDVVLEKASTTTVDVNDTPNEGEPEGSPELAKPEGESQATEPEGYQVPKGEGSVFHVKVEQRSFSPKTGEKLSKPVIQKYEKRAWQFTKSAMENEGNWTIEILHDPTK